MVLDGEGFYGALLHYSLTFALAGSALIMFIYLWKKDRLDMDEEPKLQMMHTDKEEGYDDRR